MTFPAPQISPSSPAATVSYISQASSSANLTSYTFSSQNIGTEAADRIVVVFAAHTDSANGSRTLSDITIGGVSVTTKAYILDADGFGLFSYGILSVPTGTTADIVVTTTGSANNNCGIVVFNVNKAKSSVPTATANVNTASVDLSSSITVQSGGVILGFAGIQNNASSWAWTNLTEQVDVSVGTNGSMTGACDAYVVGTTPTITAADTGTRTRHGLWLLAMR